MIEFHILAYIIDLIDNFVVVFFSLEYLIRLIICPNKFKFIKVSNIYQEKSKLVQQYI